MSVSWISGNIQSDLINNKSLICIQKIILMDVLIWNPFTTWSQNTGLNFELWICGYLSQIGWLFSSAVSQNYSNCWSFWEGLSLAAGWHCLVLWIEGGFGSETLEKHDWLPDYKRVTNSILIKAEWILNEPIMLCLTHSLMNYDFCSFLSGTKPDSKKLIVTMTAIFVFMMIVIALVVFVYVKNR